MKFETSPVYPKWRNGNIRSLKNNKEFTINKNRNTIIFHPTKKLGTWLATAICGNDITSSCLYVSALAIIAAGKYAPISLLIVGGVLYLFRKIYAETVGALPMNGGAYNALLNTTSKFRASWAACLTILSYMATAVISAGEAIHYIVVLLPGSLPSLEIAGYTMTPAIYLTIFLLSIFAVLAIYGISESAKVALIIFVFHLVSLTVLVFACVTYIAVQGTDTLANNFATDPPGASITKAIFFGFAAAMLGISGFESSANYVEEQREGVFPKTLRNMWIAVTIINPVMAFMALALIPINQVGAHHEALLSHMGNVACYGQSWLSIIISVDASLVLSGAVLTSFIGVNGLVRRMALDRCLPQFILKENRRHVTHRIVLLFLFLNISILLVTHGEVTLLAGVYTISFLAVMAFFAFGNILLKVKRAKLPRPDRASWPAVIFALIAVILGIIGNLIRNPEYARIFLTYFVPVLCVVIVMLWRLQLLGFFLFLLHSATDALNRINTRFSTSIKQRIDIISSQEVVFFSRGDHVSNLNEAMLYIKRNETTKYVKVATIVENEDEVPARLKKDLDYLNEIYPNITINMEIVKGKFTPEMLRRLSRKWDIPLNFMFIGSPGDRFPHHISDLGGVRLII